MRRTENAHYEKEFVVSDFFCIIAHHDHLATKIMTAVDGEELVIRRATILCVIYLPFRLLYLTD